MDHDDAPLTVRRSWWDRALGVVGLARSAHLDVGAEASVGTTVAPSYDVRTAMSAYAAFPWVVACVNAKATDLGGLPLVAMRGMGSQAERLDDHPALALLRTPASHVSALGLRRQLVVDLELAGNGYLALLGKGQPEALLRLHPQLVTALPTWDGRPIDYEYRTQQAGSLARYPWEQVLHVRNPSWEDGPEGVYGQGLIRALHRDLTTDLAAQKGAARSARRGRPDAVASPTDASTAWSDRQVRRIKARFDRLLDGEHGGVMVLGGAVKWEAMSWAPRDMEYQKQRELVRDAVLAVAGVPGVRVGLPTANYATAREQERIYWQNLVGEAALIDAEFTRLARLFPNSADVRIAHDFAGVPIFAYDRTERVKRVETWVLLGLPLADAAAYEGFQDLPVPARAPAAPGPRPRPGERPEPQPGEAPEAAGLGELLALPTAAPAEEQRAAIWRGFVDRLHAPSERALALAMRRLFDDQARAYSQRLERLVGQRTAPLGEVRQLGDQALDDLLAEAEEAIRMNAALRPTLREAVLRAFQEAVRQLGGAVYSFSPARRDYVVQQVLADLVVHVSQETSAAIRQIVLQGLSEGATVADMQLAIMQAEAFSATRALRVARTETTRSVNAGSVEAYAEAERQGVQVRKEWLTARDDVVRESHASLDGQVVPVDGRFTIGAGPNRGATGRYPGDFASAAEVVNCRCTVLPVVGG